MNDEVRHKLPARSVNRNVSPVTNGQYVDGAYSSKENGKIDPNKTGSQAEQTESWIQTAIEQHEDSLLRYAKHFVFDMEVARDVVQDTFLKLCRQPPESANKIRQRLAPWLFTVCRNRAIDVGRKERRMKSTPEHQLDDAALEPTHRADLSTEPSAALEKVEAAASLRQQVETLPDRQQEVLRLKFHAGLSYKEIAEVTGLTSSNVGFILHKAISKLRQRMAVE